MKLHPPERVLIVGFGSIGRRHCRIIRNLWPGVQIASVRSGKGNSCQEDLIINSSFESVSQALAWQPSMAIISSPASFHVEHALETTSASIPTLIEKPVCIGCEPTWMRNRLIDLSSSVPINVAYVLRHDICAQYMRQIIKSNRLGANIEADFYCGSWLPDWRPQQDYRHSVSSRSNLGGGALYEISHEIDLAFWFFGLLQLKDAFLQNTGILDVDVEDRALLFACSSENNPVSFRLNFCTRPPRRVVTIRGADGEVIWNLLDCTVICKIQGQFDHMYSAVMDPDERFIRQLTSFWSRPNDETSSLCSLSEGYQVLDFILSAHSLSPI